MSNSSHRILSLGDTALLIDTPGSSAASAELLRSRLEASPNFGVTDIVPAFDSVAIYFDPRLHASNHASPIATVTAWVRECLTLDAPTQETASRTVEIPVCYDEQFGPDLGELSQQHQLDPDRIVREHASARYRVAAIGFQPGFPYLEGLPPLLHTPRQSTPRTRVAAGSVGIGGPYTGVYPHDSPGGWNLIGRTPLKLFDVSQEEPSLLQVGDRVKFTPIDKAAFQRIRNQASSPKQKPAAPETPAYRVLNPGMHSTFQSLGQTGLQHLGQSPGGAMDSRSLRLANLLVGNADTMIALEATLVGPQLECLHDLNLGIAGAVPSRFAGARRIALAEGEILDLRELCGGARCYVSILGGFALQDHPLQADQLLEIANPAKALVKDSDSGASWRAFQTLPIGPTSNREILLHLIRGPYEHLFTNKAWSDFLDSSYEVASQSNRMGVRLESSQTIGITDASLSSAPVVQGAIQLPPDGDPIILSADRQTLGGYPVIGCVASVDWPKVGQLRPGDKVRFVETTLNQAEHMRRQAEHELNLIAAGIAMKQ